MIPSREVLALRDEWQINNHVIEKDWALGWVLAGIAAHSALGGWVFKGGTALRKCYYETYRFSEDLDFTALAGGPESPDEVTAVFNEIAHWVGENAGLELVVDSRSFTARTNLRGKPTLMGRVAYGGPSNRPVMPKLKIDVTSDEVVVNPPVRRVVQQPYSDSPQPPAVIACYSIVDLMAEKLRALAERCRPRDLYDVVYLFRHPDLLGRSTAVEESLGLKCAHVGIDVPTRDSIHATPFRAEIEGEWANMLEHQLPSLPPFAQFWSTLDELFAWLTGEVPVPTLPRAQSGGLDTDWTAPATMTSWRTGSPLELVRFAGANRLKVDIDYRPETGRRGRRIVEPYALRRTKGGHVVLFVVNDRGQLRSYRTDRIAGVSVTREPFQPRYRIEF